MRGRVDQHAKFRELLAARLDRSLTRIELRTLNAHLKKCLACERVDADYRAQRFLLHGLPTRIPPRDLWARTSASLDREVARAYRARKWGRRLARGRRSAQPSTALMTAVAIIGVTAAIVVLQLAPAVTPLAGVPGQPTPLEVQPQSLAMLGLGPGDTAVYSTQVSQVCPASAPDCVGSEKLVRSPVHLPTTMRSGNVALSPSGDQLAVVGHLPGQDMIAVVMMPPDANNVVDPNSGAGHSAHPDGVQNDGQTQAPVKTHQPDQSAQTAAQATDLGSGTSEPPASAVAGLTVLAILENVQSAGAAPAWSLNGGMLAFSAMPDDASSGPDVYVWSPGDDKAQAITTDHASYFASWSGNRIVVSRVNSSGRVHNSVIDPRTLEERAVNAPGLWLPTVNDQRTEAIGWLGQLDTTGVLVAPRQGALFVMDWGSVDPFGAGASDQPAPATDAPTPAATPQASQATATPGLTPSLSAPPQPRGSASPAPISTSQSATATATATAQLSPSSTPTATASATPTATDDSSNDSSVPLVALEPDRDPVEAPVLDWQVHWSSDGLVVGVWIADSTGSTWGRLAVLSVDPVTEQVATDSPLLAMTLAKRGFSMGLDRVAWIAPSDTNVDGELRIRTWGSDGIGGLRLIAPDQEDVVPAF
ncbi:MAG TPA: zf-HC2 domain-containing protein [Candidatus Limnocylindrales bacterium]